MPRKLLTLHIAAKFKDAKIRERIAVIAKKEDRTPNEIAVKMLALGLDRYEEE